MPVRYGNLPYSRSIKANGYPQNIQARQLLNYRAAEQFVFPLLDTDQSPLGRAYTDFQQLGQRLIAEGAPPSELADEGPIDVTLFFRDRLPEDPVNASTWASEMLKAFRGTLADPLLLACAAYVGNLMRWFIMPTSETYAKLPALARPTRLQRLKPHPSWIDMMVFPSFRDALVNEPRDWVGPCIEAEWQVMWPHSLDDALSRHAESQRIYLAPEFAAFVVQSKNWSMKPSILEAFREIEDTEINITAG